MGVHPSALETPAPVEARSVIVPDHDGEPESMNLRTRVEAKGQECRISAPTSNVASGAGGHGSTVRMCIADLCAHWRFRQASGTRYELRSFQSDLPIPDGNKPPVEVEDGWEFTHWEPNSLKIKAPLPRYWARRAVEIILPKGCCGLGGEP